MDEFTASRSFPTRAEAFRRVHNYIEASQQIFITNIKPELKGQDNLVSNTNTINNFQSKDLPKFISHEYLSSSDLGLFNLLPKAQGEDYEEKQFTK